MGALEEIGQGASGDRARSPDPVLNKGGGVRDQIRLKIRGRDEMKVVEYLVL